MAIERAAVVDVDWLQTLVDDRDEKAIAFIVLRPCGSQARIGPDR